MTPVTEKNGSLSSVSKKYLFEAKVETEITQFQVVEGDDDDDDDDTYDYAPAA